MMDETRHWTPLPEAAAYVGVHYARLRRRAADGTIPSYQGEGGRIYVATHALPRMAAIRRAEVARQQTLRAGLWVDRPGGAYPADDADTIEKLTRMADSAFNHSLGASGVDPSTVSEQEVDHVR